MRWILAASLVVLNPNVAQVPQPARGQLGVLVSQDAAGGVNVMLPLSQTTFYLGEPSVGVPAAAGTGALIAERFTVRAWHEGQAVRVVVYASLPAKSGARVVETPIATYAMAPGDSARVTATEEFGATPLKLRLLRRLGKP